MRPLNPFDVRFILDYFPQLMCNEIRHKCVRAVEVDELNRGEDGERSDYFKAALGLSNAIRIELGLPEVGEAGEVVASVSVASGGAANDELLAKIADLEQKLKEQEEELIAQDEEISELKQEVADLEAGEPAPEPVTPAAFGLPTTKTEAADKYSKTKLLDALYSTPQ